MRVVIIGQQAFGKAVLDAFLAEGHVIPAIFTSAEPAESRPDPLAAAAGEHGLPLLRFPNYAMPEAIAALKQCDADLGVMAYVTQFVPQSFCTVPRHGMIQFHPSLLPLHRGPSAINWAIIRGRSRTGLTVFRPTDGLDEGPVLLQKEVEILPEDTVGSVYFDKIFPLGVAALLETAAAILDGSALDTAQDETEASYESWVRHTESRIDWARHVDFVYDLIRGCNPAPGAWTLWEGRRLQLFDARKSIARRFAAVRGLKLGEVTAVTPESFTVHAQGGFIEVQRCRVGDNLKMIAGEAGIAVGTILGA